ncbi:MULTISPECIES: hypothetical protein [unclassified Enterococcus]|uniref:hypothetical protein n=1 Tax=unclassified Enterococcus TaxID=2608891 RepID=UPI001554EE12|nr:MULTISPECIES: hypothetical protein [unclassified Enterococcus]MBS7576975.1 hypothetical protein [Enterococcus sp. MMGLQ5-2]MBS7584382.1 hypothetical protein [Enterococcus sp. MMGLQ5-1]NPD12237.1 hypothetical protein [Enterococcus sp. MMGLQ5-1]NPD36809.1 hypothetical protein [Enterococcus sp. MMGLQ5-2]
MNIQKQLESLDFKVVQVSESELKAYPRNNNDRRDLYYFLKKFQSLTGQTYHISYSNENADVFDTVEYEKQVLIPLRQLCEKYGGNLSIENRYKITIETDTNNRVNLFRQMIRKWWNVFVFDSVGNKRALEFEIKKIYFNQSNSFSKDEWLLTVSRIVSHHNELYGSLPNYSSFQIIIEGEFKEKITLTYKKPQQLEFLKYYYEKYHHKKIIDDEIGKTIFTEINFKIRN